MCYIKNLFLNFDYFLFSDCRLAVIKKHHRSFYDRYDVVDSLTFQDFKDFCANFVNTLKIKMLIQGNIIESRAKYIVQLVNTNMGVREFPASQVTDDSEIFQIPLGTSYLKIKSMRNNDKNSVLKNYYQVGKATIHNECLSELLVSVINEPLFNTLRSHEQLGYGVSCTLRKNCGVLGITITVEYQENKNCADVIDRRIQEFLETFYDILKLTSEDDFKSVKRSIMSLKLILDTDLEKEVNRNWDEIRNGENVFDRNELEAFEMETLTKSEIIDFYSDVFLTASKARKLSVQVIGDGNPIGNQNIRKLINSEEKSLRNGFVRELIEFRAKLEIF